MQPEKASMDTTSRIVGNIKQPQPEQPQQPSKTEKKSAKKTSGVEKNFPVDFDSRRWSAGSVMFVALSVRPRVGESCAFYKTAG